MLAQNLFLDNSCSWKIWNAVSFVKFREVIDGTAGVKGHKFFFNPVLTALTQESFNGSRNKYSPKNGSWGWENWASQNNAGYGNYQRRSIIIDKRYHLDSKPLATNLWLRVRWERKFSGERKSLGEEIFRRSKIFREFSQKGDSKWKVVTRVETKSLHASLVNLNLKLKSSIARRSSSLVTIW